MLFWHRWRARARIDRALGLWYHRDYAAPDIPAARRIAHMQTDRVEKALARLARLGLLTSGDIRSSPSISIAELERVHTRSYLARTTAPEVLGAIFGLLPADVEVDALLNAQRRAVGGTVEAALATASGRIRVGFNLGGGFHHAAAERGAGYCIFNDTAVAVAVLRTRGFREPIAVVDLDFHQGDGNIDLFADDPSVLVYSIHGAVWTHRVGVNCQDHMLPPGARDGEYLDLLDETLRPALSAHGTRFVFYLAGVDVLAGDLLGDFALSPSGVLARDRRVIAAADFVRAPLVITMAGGYGPGAWQCTANLIRYLLTGVTMTDRSPAEKLRYRFAKISREITPWQWQREEDLVIREEDLALDRNRRPRHTMLGYFSTAGIEMAFERYGILNRIRARGFVDLCIEVRPDDPDAQVVRISGSKAAASGAEPLLLIELVMSRRPLRAPHGELEYEVLELEWLLMQDPTSEFSPTCQRLAGQKHPGLGMAHEVHQLLVELALQARLDGLLHHPAYYHTAVLTGREYNFLCPDAEGSFQALRRVLASMTLAEATRAVERGGVAFGDGRRFVWEPSARLRPASERLAAYFGSRSWREHVRARVEEVLAAGLHLV